VWDGKRWAPDETGEAMRQAKETVRDMFRHAGRILDRAADIEDEAERKEVIKKARSLMKFAVDSEAKHALKAMLELAETEIPIPITLDQLDAEPGLLNVQNGTIDLSSGELREHNRDDLITRICPVAFDPSAHDERWMQFLDQVMPDKDVRRYVQKSLGYSLTGSGVEGDLFLPYGPTHTGKTTLLEVSKAALGSYALTMDVETLTGSGRNRDGARPRHDIVRLFGARLVISTEVPAGVRLDEALIKKFTGQDSLFARGVYARDGQDGKATFSIWLGSNFRPLVRDDDAAIWNRVKQIPFQEQHLGTKDKTLKPYLETEAREAVLAWLVEGAVLYAKEGLDPPAAVTTLTEDYRREMNPLATWAAECCEMGKDLKSAYSPLRWSYEEFTRRGDRPVGARRFMNSLASLPGVTYERESRLWHGIRAAEHPGEPTTDEQFAGMVQGVDS
jgi:putative DNA primase/helicase